MRSVKFAAFAAFAALVASPAGAQEVRLGMFGSLEYDDNVFNAEDNKIDDTAIRTGPILALRQNQGRLVYEVRYEPRFETFIDGSVEDNWDHLAFGSASYQISPRTTLEMSNRFLLTQSQNRAGVISPGASEVAPVAQVEVGRQQITRNLAAAALNHTFSSRLSGTASFNYSLFRTDRDDRFDSDIYSGNAQASYILSTHDNVGGGFGITYQDFSETDTQPGRTTTFYRLYATWFHTFDPTFTLSVQGGPTFIDSSQTSDAPIAALVPAFPFESTETGGVRLIDSTTCPTTDDGQPYVADRCELFGTELTGQPAASVRGQTFLATQADDEGGDDSTPTLFARIEIQKRWEHWRVLGSFVRSDSTASGAGQSTVLNSVVGQLVWDPDDRWRVQVVGSWALRQSATNQTANGIGLGPPGPFAFPPVLAPGTVVTSASPATNLRIVDSDDFTDITTYRAEFGVTRFLGRQSQVFARYVYLNQSFDGTTAGREFDNHRIQVGFRWILDWIPL